MDHYGVAVTALSTCGILVCCPVIFDNLDQGTGLCILTLACLGVPLESEFDFPRGPHGGHMPLDFAVGP